jgi:hypothetical protein
MYILIPLGDTRIDWKSYLRVCQQALNKNVLTELDEQWITPTQSLSDYICSLKMISGNNVVSNLLDHVHITFILVAVKSTTVKLITITRLVFTTTGTIHDDYNLSIVSGNLNQWRTAMMNCCADDQSIDVKDFGSKIYDYFDKIGLRKYVLDMTKIPNADGTINLIK